MQLSRREFLKTAAAVTVATVEFAKVQEALAGNGDPPVIWLQGQGCTGCSVSFLNSVVNVRPRPQFQSVLTVTEASAAE